MTDVTFKIAGQAGQGMQSISFTLGRLLSRGGYHVFVNQDVMSRIRGGHNLAQMRICDRPVHGPAEKVNILIALDDPSLDLHQDELVPGGVAIFDGEPRTTNHEPTNPTAKDAKDANLASSAVLPTDHELPATGNERVLLPVPLTRFAKTIGRNPVVSNAVAMGAIMGLTGYPLDLLLEALKETFAAKGAETIRANIACAKAGFDHIWETFKGKCACVLNQSLSPAPRPQSPLFLTGNEAIALGAICSGVRFHSGYPMSPSTPIMEYLAANARDLGIIVEQSEDEIAGINMALGASYAGVRSMTATSGGGFALMVEGLGWSAMSETPIVIVLCSRPGPATGFPTRTEQADLLFALHASQDEFPRFIFAPGNAEQAFYLTNRAFDLSQKYNVPAFVLADQFLCDSYATVQDFDLGRSRIEDYDQSAQARKRKPYSYKRYGGQGSGVRDPGSGPTPEPRPLAPNFRLRPGTPNQVVIAAGHEHDAAGYITESADDRIRLMDARMAKLEPMRRELSGPTCYPDEKSAIPNPQSQIPNPQSAIPNPQSPIRPLSGTALVCFGSTLGPVSEAVDILRSQGADVSMVHISEVYPLPCEPLLSALSGAPRILTVENNATAQLARLIHAELQVPIRESVLKYDGRPFTAEEIAREVSKLL